MPTPAYPCTVDLGGTSFELRFMHAGDEDAVLAFARALPAHDLLFLPRDITQPKVMEAWMHEDARGAMTSLLAAHDGAIVGCATVVRDPLSWSPHVAEVRVVVGVGARGKGLGRLLTERAVALAIASGTEKLVAHMTADQVGAITVFETMGYRAEALLRDHVRDRDGVKHDLVILSHDVEAFRARLEAYGLDAALGVEPREPA
ncbi:MAG TPA: GNAT family N-acetyltransferase [Candidatus Elarobacter sp.]|nr:GNAT family N-acetyltransferase [Candidatus Elarobacter sp.]